MLYENWLLSMRKKTETRGRKALPEAEKKITYSHRFRPREHLWIKANRAYIEKQAKKEYPDDE